MTRRGLVLQAVLFLIAAALVAITWGGGLNPFQNVAVITAATLVVIATWLNITGRRP